MSINKKNEYIQKRSLKEFLQQYQENILQSTMRKSGYERTDFIASVISCRCCPLKGECDCAIETQSYDGSLCHSVIRKYISGM